jgi:nucleotide-binding universal stress UspA family protein
MDERQSVIVCGVDGSSAGDRALRWAIDDAVRRSGAVRAVTAWSWDGLEDFGAASTAAEAFERARRVLDASVDRAIDTTEDPPVIERICQRGTPSDALCDAAVDAELLVLGSHGHGTAHDKLVGSTSDHVMPRGTSNAHKRAVGARSRRIRCRSSSSPDVDVVPSRSCRR